MRVDLAIRQGATFKYVYRWEQLPIIYKPISAVVNRAPLRMTVTGHGLPTGWRAAITNVKGMTELNAQHTPPLDEEFVQVIAVDANTIEVNSINATDFEDYVSGGVLQYYTPAPLASYTARAKIRDRVGGTMLLELTTENSRIAIDSSAFTITLQLTPAVTEGLAFTRGVYDLEVVSPGGVVTPLAYGQVRLIKEVTTAI